ncbi:NAD(P)/FAD-dependent oxidoreductase [Afipia massiliensis]|uniref:NAD(P)/FAD-dependent oxidoreductase n=1 Tax=Afipia massiliensis TaxID=211460 RepID=A0A4U6BSH8_9BRAD|nr:NAD(P)/FAD-dependent oxidoreductase [Afipia massiliensis]TKT71724.1 NAD(P)/FAD-dependent oxidoreductase [Afipia massiliensis]
MARYDAVIVGAGLGGLTTGAILARAGRKVLVIERSNSVGGAASSYKVGDLFVEGSLHETSDPNNPRDPKHDPLMRAGVLDAVTWIPSNTFYEVRGGPVGAPLTLPDNFDAARRALIQRFPDVREGIERLLGEMEQIASAVGVLSRGARIFKSPSQALGALRSMLPAIRDWNLSLSQKLDRVFGNNEAVKAALAANLSYYHDDPATTWWVFFAAAQGSYLLSSGRFVQGGSQRLSSALARAIKTAGSDVILRRTASAISVDSNDRIASITHTAKDGSDPQSVETTRVIGNAAPEILAALLPETSGAKLLAAYGHRQRSISLFALTLGLMRPPRELGVSSYSTQLLPDWMTKLNDYAQATALMADEPGRRMPPLAIVDYAAIESGVPAPPYVLSVVGPDLLSNWTGGDQDSYRAKRARWQDALVGYLDGHYPGLRQSITASTFNTALSVQQYLGAPQGAVYGFAPTPPCSLFSTQKRSPATPIPGLYLASAYTGFGGYTGVIQSGGACADMILRER